MQGSAEVTEPSVKDDHVRKRADTATAKWERKEDRDGVWGWDPLAQGIPDTV